MVEYLTFNQGAESSNLSKHTRHYRGVAQLAEWVFWEHQAEGSSPFAPTRKRMDGCGYN